VNETFNLYNVGIERRVAAQKTQKQQLDSPPGPCDTVTYDGRHTCDRRGDERLGESCGVVPTRAYAARAALVASAVGARIHD
jgi:hypothetical protein